MPKKKSDDKAAILERFERGLRNALSTPPGQPIKGKKKKGKRKKHGS